MTTRTLIPTVSMAFSQYARGMFYLDHSLLDGIDGLFDGNAWPFLGAYDDVTGDVDGEVQVVLGMDDLAGVMQASTCDFTLKRPTDPGYWNPRNASSAPNSVTPGFKEMRPVKVTTQQGIDASLTVSGSPTFNGDGTCTIDATGADTVEAPVSLIDETQGWWAMRFAWGIAYNASAVGRYVLIGWGDNSNDRIWLSYNTGTDQIALSRGSTAAGGLNELVFSTVQSFAIGDVVTIVAAWTASKLRISINGSAFQEGTYTKIPTLAASVFRIGARPDSWGHCPDNRWHWLASGTGTLTDTDAAQIATWTDAQTTLATGLPAATASLTAVWTCESSTYLTYTNYGLFWGFIRSARFSAEDYGCRVHCEDLLLWLARQYPVITNPGATTTGAAIGLILDACGWSDPDLRDLAAGDSISAFTAADGTQTAVQLIAGLIQAERGVVYIDPTNGVFTYKARSYAPSAVAVATLTDQLSDLGADLDVDRISTRVTVTRTGGTAQTATDSTAELTFGRADLPGIDTPYLPDDATAALLAADLLYQVKQSAPPVRGLIENESAAVTNLQLTLRPLQAVTIVETLAGTSGQYNIAQLRHRLSAQGAYLETDFLAVLRPASMKAFAIDVSGLDGTDVIRY